MFQSFAMDDEICNILHRDQNIISKIFSGIYGLKPLIINGGIRQVHAWTLCGELLIIVAYRIIAAEIIYHIAKLLLKLQTET